MKKALKIIIDILFIIIIIILLGYFILTLTGKLYLYEVKTGSMEPTIKVNDYILVYKDKDYKKEDILTFEYENSLVTHRIVKKDKNKIITRGDANNTDDDEIDLNSVIGKVIIIGGVLNFVVNYKYAIIAFMLATYFFTCYLNGDKKEKVDKDDEEKEKIES